MTRLSIMLTRPESLELEGSGDGKRWTTIEDKTSGQNDSKEDTVENKTGKPRYFLSLIHI